MRERGYDRKSWHVFEEAWFVNVSRSNQPKVLTVNPKKNMIVKIEANQYGCEMTTTMLEHEIGVKRLKLRNKRGKNQSKCFIEKKSQDDRAGSIDWY